MNSWDLPLYKWDYVKVLGKGSYGKVYLAQQEPTYFSKEEPTYFAVKAAPIERSSTLSKEEHILQHFIGCPEIVQCLGSEITTKPNSSKLIYNLKLEYAAGRTLDDLIRRKKKLPENEAKEYLKMILKGLSQIHGKGFVHADLKPHNILVFPQADGEVKLKIADFGLSMRHGDKNEKDSFGSFKFKGTPAYMSPESVTSPEFNTALDIWSLGCTFIRMVSGKPVWRYCTDSIELATKLVFKEVPKIPKDMSREGRDFVRKCFDHDTTKRWTADMLLQHPYLKEEPEVPMKTIYMPHELYKLNRSKYKRETKLEEELYISQNNASKEKALIKTSKMVNTPVADFNFNFTFYELLYSIFLFICLVVFLEIDQLISQ